MLIQFKWILIVVCSFLPFHLASRSDESQSCLLEYSAQLNGTAWQPFHSSQHPHSLRPVSMRTVIIHASPGTTATRSLAQELAGLGVTLVHWRQCYGPNCWRCRRTGALAAWIALEEQIGEMDLSQVRRYFVQNEARLSCFDGFSDSPVARLFWVLSEIYPRHLVIWTDRAPEAWAKARRAHAEEVRRPTLVDSLHLAPVIDARKSLLLSNYADKDLAQLFAAHRQLVLCATPAESLLFLDYFAGHHHDGERISLTDSIREFLIRHHWPIREASDQIKTVMLLVLIVPILIIVAWWMFRKTQCFQNILNQ